jgi:hypothetical protein
MTYKDDWKAIASRIKGLIQAGELHARFLGIRSSDSYARARQLRHQCERILSAIETYCDTHKASLPTTVLTAMEAFKEANSGLIRDTSGTADLQDERVWAALVLLGGFETEISFLISDREEVVRARSERAFAHLQRSIVADPEFGEKWQSALDQGEVQCERLGGAHLLLHGIYAFKINAEGERTDLVFQDVVGELADEQRYADGLVLTEWKVAASDLEAAKQFEAARMQAGRYERGALGGSELAGYRYLVVVSSENVRTPADIVLGNVLYRHINIAVRPRTPSGKRVRLSGVEGRKDEG